MNMQTIHNDSDLQLLFQSLSLYLKPIASIIVSINLPSNVTGKTISNFDVMDKLRQMIIPDTFSLLKVSKTTLELLRFDAELEDRNQLNHVIVRLNGRQVKLNGFSEYAKIKAYESRIPYPTKHDWDSFFRDAKNMDEMHAGERPDTIYISNLPIRWFCPRHHENDDSVKPSEVLFKRIFEKFGDVRTVDIPICDPYRNQMKGGLTGLRNFSFDNETYFEGYVQFSEYSSFVRCMDEFRAMKLVRKDKDKIVAVNIEVDFDKTKHLSDVSIKRRKVIRERLMEKDRQKAEEEERKYRIEQEKRDKEKQKEEVRKQIQLEKRRQREERRKQRNIKKITESESSDLTKKILKEQRKLLKVQRKMESIRLLEALFDRIKSKFPADDNNDHASKDFKGFGLRKKLKKNKKKTKHDGERSKSVSSDASSISKKKSNKQRDSSASSTASSSSSSSDESLDRRSKSKSTAVVPGGNGMPMAGWMPNPETGEWFPASYMYAPFFPPGMVRPYFNPNYRGNYPRRGRGRGRGYYGNDGRYHKRYDDDYYHEHDNRRSYSRSPRRRSYSRSRSRTRSRRRRSYSRSRSHSRSSRSRSKHSTSRSSSRHRSTSRPKLVTTLRDGNTRKTPPTTRHQSRSRSGSGWSSDDNSNHKRKKRRTWSRETSPSKEMSALEPNKLLKSAKEIQRHVQKKLKEQQEAEERKMKEMEKQLEEEAEEIERRMEREANGESGENSQSDKNDQHTPEKSKETTPVLYTPPPLQNENLTPEITA